MAIQTANGPIELDALGQTLMHEHLVMAMAGWESDTSAPVRRGKTLSRFASIASRS